MIVDLAIASFKIRLRSEEGSDITLSERFRSFISKEESVPDVILDVFPSGKSVPGEAKKVFEAPLIDEEGQTHENEPFWVVSEAKEKIYVQARTIDTGRKPLLILSRTEKTWQIFSDCREGDNDPLPYPADGLLLYYLTSFSGSIMIHASGADVKGKGWLFSGRSGKGKTTIAGIFDRSNDRIIHDDRLILAKSKSGWMMYSTPVYRNDEPRSANLDHIWIISHGRSNISSPVAGAEAAGLIMANCIQQNWDRDATARLATTVEGLISSVPVSKLQFVPDQTVRDYLVAHEDKEMKSVFRTAAALLDDQSIVSITAGGSSMWPAIKPGDKVLIEPLHDTTLALGDIVALVRDGGYVVHRITAILFTDKGNSYRTRGDSSSMEDPMVQHDEIAGIVRQVIRSGTKVKVGKRNLPFLFNRVAAFFAKRF